MNWSNFSFEYPYVFLLFGLYFLCKKFCKVKTKEAVFSNVKLIETLTYKENKTKEFLEFLLLSFLIISLASPVIKQTIQKTDTSGYEIAIALDASYSMKDDNRFEITKDIVSEFIKNRTGDRLSLSLFAEHVYLAVPFTYDKKPLQIVLEYTQIGVAGSVGTSLYDSVYLMGNLFKDSKSKNKIAILLTDGIDTKNNIALDIAINNVKKHGIKVYVIAVGNEDEFNKNILQEIATKTNGKFFHTTNPKELKHIYNQIDTLEKSSIETQKYIKVQYLYKYPLFIVFLCVLVLLFQRSEKKVLLYLLLGFIFLSYIKPTLELDNQKTKQNIKFMIALDISKSMLANDIKPTRFDFAKEKIITLLDRLEDEEVSLLAFSNQTYLISPFTNNYEHLKTFVTNLHLSNVNQNGTEYLKLLKHSNSFFAKESKKAILFFSDGGESDDFSKEIEYAKQNNQSIFVYLIGTTKGSAIKVGNKLVRDGDKQIVLSKQNEAIKSLSSHSDGMVYYGSHKQNDLDEFLQRLKKDFNNNDGYNNSQFPLFVLFLFGSLLVFFLWRFEVKVWKK